jgi:hypothetical protein
MAKRIKESYVRTFVRRVLAGRTSRATAGGWMPKPTKLELDLAEGFLTNELDNGLAQQIVEAAEEEN